MKTKFGTGMSRAGYRCARISHVGFEAVESRVLFATTPAVTGFTLINADTDQPISGVTLTDASVLDLSKLPTKNLNVRADVGSGVASVKFGYDSNSNYRTENAAPFALASNNGLDYYAWTPTSGSHTLSATPYSSTGATGTAGSKKTISFSVISGSTSSSSTVVNLMVTDGIAREGNTSDPGTVLVTRNGSLSSSLTVNLTVGGTATEGSDYQKLPRTITIPAGSASAAVTITTIGDPITEPAETVLVGLASGSGYTIDSGAFPAVVTIPESDQAASDRGFSALATASGTTGLNVSWTLAPSNVSSYRITYTPGTYNGVTKTLDLPGSATGANLTGLSSFTLYSIDVTAADSGGTKTTTHVNAWTAQPSTLKRYLYAVDAPKNRVGFTNNVAQIQVYDVNNNHAWVKNIPLPSGIYNIRGVAGSAATNRLYVSYHTAAPDDDQPGGLLCINLTTDALVWRKDYSTSQVASPDRFDITPDGKKIYMPTGESGTQNKWAVIDAATGSILRYVTHVSSPHNAIVSLDGKYAFLEGQEKGSDSSSILHTIGVVDTSTDQVVKKVGPFRDVVRPFTVNGKGTLLFATVDNFVGFQVADVISGTVLFTAVPPGISQPPAVSHESYSHGIALTPDEKEVWVVDDGRAGFHVWDVSGVASGQAPKYLQFVQVRRQGRDMSGKTTSAASNDTIRAPRWIVPSYDGKYMYAEGGEVIDVAAKKVVGQLRPMQKNSSGQLVQGPYAHSRFEVEVDFDNGAPVRVTDQFGIGRAR
jgi:hypothetical protein